MQRVPHDGTVKRRGYLSCGYCGGLIRRQNGQRRCRCSDWHDGKDGQTVGRTQFQGLLWTHLEMPALPSRTDNQKSGR